MNWKEKILAGMALMQKGCTEAGNYNCGYCPFEKYCVEPFPIDWNLESEE